MPALCQQPSTSPQIWVYSELVDLPQSTLWDLYSLGLIIPPASSFVLVCLPTPGRHRATLDFPQTRKGRPRISYPVLRPSYATALHHVHKMPHLAAPRPVLGNHQS